MTGASSNPYLAGVIALVTAPAILAAAQSGIKGWYDRTKFAGDYKVHYTGESIPQRLAIPPPPFEKMRPAPPKWGDRGYRKGYWAALRVLYCSLAVFYAIAGVAAIAIFVRKSPLILVVAALALLSSAYFYLEFLRIGRRAWDHDFTTCAEVTVSGTRTDVIAMALSAVSGTRGRLITVDSAAGQVIVSPDRKTRLEILVETADGTLVRVTASIKPVSPTKIQSRPSIYRHLYAFMENFLAQCSRETIQVAANSTLQSKLVKWPQKRGSSP